VRIVNLSLSEVAEALEECTYDIRYVLDLQEQEIIRLSEYAMTDDEIHEFFEEVDGDETGRYISFPIRIDSRDGYADMEGFIENIEDPQIRGRAEDTIRGSGAFRRFREFIGEYPELETRWYTWKDERARVRATDWLDEEGLGIGKKGMNLIPDGVKENKQLSL
ncbi:MAG: UPF0158 family protein, partial [Methanobacteriota archaeon]